jgi:hypothetical protein
MSRLFTLFALGALGLFLTPLTASAQFRPPFGIPGAPAFPVPFAPPVVAPLPVYSVLPNTITRALPNFVLYRQFYPGTIGGGFSVSTPYMFNPSPTNSMRVGGSATGREDALLAEQQNLEKAQKAATQAASVSPVGLRGPAQGGVLDSGNGGMQDLNPALLPADATQIASGEALNKVFKAIVAAEAKGAKGPSAYIPPLLIKDVRFAGSPNADLLNFVRQDGLDVPAALGGAELAKEFAAVAETLRAGKPADPARVGQLNATWLKVTDGAAAALKGAPEADAKAAQEFMTRFGGAMKVLQAGANGLVDPTWAAEGLSGEQLVKHMAKFKLEFAPAPRGAAESYETLHKHLSTYLFVLTKKK